MQHFLLALVAQHNTTITTVVHPTPEEINLLLPIAI